MLIFMYVIIFTLSIKYNFISNNFKKNLNMYFIVLVATFLGYFSLLAFNDDMINKTSRYQDTLPHVVLYKNIF